MEVAVEQEVDVDGPVVVDAVPRLRGPPQFALYALRLPETLARRERGQHLAGSIEEGMLALEPPGLRLDERRDALHRPDALTNQLNSPVQSLFPIPKITT